MSRPRVFISSTFYDLRHIRTDLERFVKEIGYEPIRNEKGDIPYGVEHELEDYCYKEVLDVDILVGIIGNRYGSDSKDKSHSITQMEIKTAFEQGKQVYIFIDRNVYSEYGTYTLNKGKDIIFKYADDIKIYEFIEEIMSIRAGIIIQPFEHVYEITNFLKAQWAGLFRDFLRQNSEKKQIEKLSAKINDLADVTETIKSYFERALPKVLPEDVNVVELIHDENIKLDEKKTDNKLQSIWYIGHLENVHKINPELVKKGLLEHDSLLDLIKYYDSVQGMLGKGFHCLKDRRINDLNVARTLLGKDPYKETETEVRNFVRHEL